MGTTKRIFLGALSASTIAFILVTGCGGKNDAINQAEKTEKDRPSIAETKDIAEQGFIFGLPLVMSYGIMYAYSIDKGTDQFKAPINQIFNEARVFTYKDTTIPLPNSDTPYSVLFMDLRTEPLVISVPAVEKKR